MRERNGKWRSGGGGGSDAAELEEKVAVTAIRLLVVVAVLSSEWTRPDRLSVISPPAWNPPGVPKWIQTKQNYD